FVDEYDVEASRSSRPGLKLGVVQGTPGRLMTQDRVRARNRGGGNHRAWQRLLMTGWFDCSGGYRSRTVTRQHQSNPPELLGGQIISASLQRADDLAQVAGKAHAYRRRRHAPQMVLQEHIAGRPRPEDGFNQAEFRVSGHVIECETHRGFQQGVTPAPNVKSIGDPRTQ